MADSIEALERRIDQLRVNVRIAVLAQDRALASVRRAELAQAEQSWERALAVAAAPPPVSGPATWALGARVPAGSLLPLREQVHETLALLQVPATPRLIATVHEAFFGSAFPSSRVTSLKRDEERSFRGAPFARPYFICAALAADSFAPSRGLLAISTWPMARRTIGPLSPRVDFLTAALRVADAIERIPDPPAAASRLLLRFAAGIPGATPPPGRAPAAEPPVVRQAAEAELSVQASVDAQLRQEAADRAMRQLGHAEQLFGLRPGPAQSHPSQ